MKTTLKYLALTSILGLSSQWALANDTDFVSRSSPETQVILSGDEEPINDLHLVLISDEEQTPEADHSDEHTDADADDSSDQDETTPTIEEEQPADDQDDTHVDEDDMSMQDSDNIE